MRNTPLISIVITCHNAYKFLDKCFSSLRTQTFKDFEVVFVDNDSPDQSLEFIKRKYPETVIVESLKDLGFAGANNLGATVTKGKYLFLLNADTYLDPDTMLKLSKYLKRHPDCHIGQMDIRNYTKTNLKDPPFTFNIDRFGYPIAPGNIFYADGAGIIITRELFFKLRGFDERFYMYLEDLDLSWRARLIGEDVHILEGIYVFHYAGGTSVSTQLKQGNYTTSYRRRYDAQKNNLRSLIKNYALSTLIWTLPTSILLASAEGWLYLLKGNLRGFYLLHKAIWWNLVNIKDTLSARREIQGMRKISDKVILDYADKRISKFHSLLLHGVPRVK